MSKYEKLPLLKAPYNARSGIKCSGRPYHFQFFKVCLPQILLGPFLNSLPQIQLSLRKTKSNKSGIRSIFR